jgi:hypothetical protein
MSSENRAQLAAFTKKFKAAPKRRADPAMIRDSEGRIGIGIARLNASTVQKFFTLFPPV